MNRPSRNDPSRFGASRKSNADRLENLYWLFRGASFLLAVGVFAWIVQLKGGT